MASSHQSGAKPVSVLFVCLGNICRSPMAEGVFRHLSNHPHNPLLSTVDSAGTDAYHAGDDPDPRTRAVLAAHGITSYTHSARRLTHADFRAFDLLLTMDAENLADMRRLRARLAAKAASAAERERLGRVVMFGDFGGAEDGEEVADPYYGEHDGFDTAYKQVVRFSEGLLAHLQEEAQKVEGEDVA